MRMNLIHNIDSSEPNRILSTTWDPIVKQWSWFADSYFHPPNLKILKYCRDLGEPSSAVNVVFFEDFVCLGQDLIAVQSGYGIAVWEGVVPLGHYVLGTFH